jgi:hypothetical protein
MLRSNYVAKVVNALVLLDILFVNAVGTVLRYRVLIAMDSRDQRPNNVSNAIVKKVVDLIIVPGKADAR